MKTEPEVFSFSDFLKQRQKETFWEGVRNYQARNLMRDQFQLGDLVLIYHSNMKDPVIAGVAEVVGLASEDRTAMDKENTYFDEDAYKKQQNPWVGVTLRAIFEFSTPVTRSQLKELASLRNMMVLKKGARLSVQPVSKVEFEAIFNKGNPKAV